MSCFATQKNSETRSLTGVTKSGYDTWLSDQPKPVQTWINGSGFKAKAGAVTIFPDKTGAPNNALVVLEDDQDLWSWGAAAVRLPAGRYCLMWHTMPV